jgi:peptidyl-Lys metalloendopeptidase
MPRRRALLAGAALTGALMAAPFPTTAATAPTLRCELTAPAAGRAGAMFELRFAITNTGPHALRVLDWNTPFEPGWFHPFVELTRDGQPLAYRGASMKRGDPAAADYLTLAAHRTRRARADLALAFDLSQPGRYRALPRFVLHDVAPRGAPVPRARDAMQAHPLLCNSVEFELK